MAKEASAFTLHTPVEIFLEPCKNDLGAIDLKPILAVMREQWIDTVRDLLVIVQERCIRELKMPQSLSEWIKQECSNKEFGDKIVDKIKTILHEQNSYRGILHWLGTKGKTQQWRNPVDMELVRVTFSSLMHDSAPAKKLLAAETLRIVTKPDPKSWFAFDVSPRKIKANMYMIRHYSSWDTEALRNWDFQASNDGLRWTTLKEYKNDQTIRKKGQECFFHVQTRDFYSHFRIFQTGPNSNRHHYLACSGFELFGDLRNDTPQRKAGLSNVFVYHYDFDENGIIHWLGTAKGTRRWQNPHNSRQMRVIWSSNAADSEPPEHAVGKTTVRCVSEAKPGQWCCFDLLDHRVCPTHYTIRHYSSFDTECLRNWQFQGSNDSSDGLNGRWDVIMDHRNDTGLEGRGASFTWTVPPEQIQGRSWSKFRLFQTGVNSNQHHYLACSGFEIYGKIVDNQGANNFVPVRPPAPSQPVAQAPGKAPVAQPPGKAAEGGPQGQQPRKPSVPAGNTKTFNFSHHFDENGIVYWLATRGKTAPWQNPGQLGLVRVAASSVMNDSEPLHAAVGRDNVRCVTKPAEGSWMSFNFGQVKVKPSYYMIRHYSSWDTEALRDWVFEASNDQRNWDNIRTHSKDSSLQNAGQCFTWPVDCAEFYSNFRLRMTGANSNNHFYLACSGFDIYGAATGPGVTSNFPRPSQGQALQRPRPSKEALFQYQHDMDTNGLLYYIGTEGLTQPWKNPADAGWVQCRCSALMNDSAPLNAIVGRTAVRTVSKPMRGAWMSVSLNDYAINPNAYSLRHYSSWDTEALRNWRFEGSNDNQNWTCLREHRNDTSLNHKGQVHTWRLECSGYYSKFRVLQFDKNSNHHLYLSLSGMELYGDVLKQSTSLTFDDANPDNKSTHLQVQVQKNSVMNTGSSDSWQTVKTKQPISFRSGAVQTFTLLVERSEDTTNSWQFIGGVAPVEFRCSGNKQWLGSQGSWGYIAGTGGKCYQQPKSENYGLKWGKPGDVMTCRINAQRKTIAFAVNGKNQEAAFTNFVMGTGVSAAVSMTGKGSRIRLMERVTAANQPVAVRSSVVRSSSNRIVQNEKTWNMKLRSKQCIVHPDGITVENKGSNDTWVCIVANKTYQQGVRSFEVVMTKDAKSTNTWKSIVGIVPSSFKVQESAWIGSQTSWGYIGGTGGKCHRQGKSEHYGKEFGTGDVIKVTMDFNRKTVEFFVNGKSQGVAFNNLVGPCHPAISLTGAGSVAKLVV